MRSEYRPSLNLGLRIALTTRGRSARRHAPSVRVIRRPNVLVSAVVASGVSAELLDRWLTHRPFELMVCPILIAELRGVLA